VQTKLRDRQGVMRRRSVSLCFFPSRNVSGCRRIGTGSKKKRPTPEKYAHRGTLVRTKAETTMRNFGLIMILSLGLSLAVRAQDQGPVQKTGKTVENAAIKTGQTVEHGVQATERTVGKGFRKAGNTLEKARNGTTSSHRHHARTKGSTAKENPSPSPKAESSPVASPSPSGAESAPTPMSSPASTPAVSSPAPSPMSSPATAPTPSR
jgi:hypothetical protein